MSVKVSGSSLLPLLVIGILFVSILSPVFHPVSWAVAQDPSVPVSVESPLACKKSAVIELSIVNGSGQDKVIIEQAEKGLQNSVDSDFWDDYHIQNPLTIAGDLLIVKLLQTTSAFKNGSSQDHQVVVSCIRDVALSDRGLAIVSIGDASNASLRVKDSFTLKLVNASISKAKNSQATAESYLQSQNMAKAIEYYGISWGEANLALLLADGKVSPIVTITSPVNGTYVSTSTINVSGMVDDVAVYSISNVTLLVNGKSFVVPVSAGKFSQQVQFQEGINVIKVTVKDLCGNKGTVLSQVVIDTMKPVISITGLSDGEYYNTSVQPVVKISETNPGSSSILLDGAIYSGGLVSGDGAHLLQAEVTDLAGNTANADVSFIIDRTPPLAELYGVQVNSYLGRTVLIDGGMLDANPGSLSLRIDGVEVSTQLPYQWNTSNYQDGDHALELFVEDLASNTGSSLVPVTVDNTRPTVRLLAPGNSTLSPSSLIRFLWSGSDNYGISFYRLFIDNASAGNTTGSNQMIEGLSDGSHQAMVEAYDLANNTAMDSASFMVDATPPSINISDVEEGRCYGYIVTPYVNVSDVNLNFSTMTLNGMAYDGEYIGDEGSYSLYVYAEDLARNNASKTINFTIYKTPPSLSVQELTVNPTLKLPLYGLIGSVDANATLTINGVTVAHDEYFNYSTNVTEGVNDFMVIATGPSGNTARWNKTRLVDQDMLPDFYEANVTHTDSLNGDTDSNGIFDDQDDPDHDGLMNLVEYVFGTDPGAIDSDGDRLPDLYELETAFTSPLKLDTDGNGISDADEDPDKDMLHNLREYEAGSLPNVKDSDGDGIPDLFEVEILYTNPISKDSDNDGIEDFSEYKLGTDINSNDTNGDGVPDGNETFTTKASNASLGVSVSITGKGDLANSVKLVEGPSAFNNISGLVSPVVDVSLDRSFDSATMCMHYTPGWGDDDYSLGYYDEDLGLFVIVPSLVDPMSHNVYADVTHFSVWGVFETNALQELYNSVSSFNEEGVENASILELSLNGHSQQWPYDVRFTNAEDTSLNYWIESYDDNSAVVWVKAGQVPTAPGDAKLNVYYGKTGDTDGSSGTGTFLAYHGEANASYADSTTVGYDSLAYQTSVRRIGELNSIVYGLKSLDDSDYLYIELNGTGNRNGVAKNSETIGSVLVSDGFGRLANGSYERTAVGSYSFYWDGNGRVYLSQSPTSLESTGADDAFDVTTQYGSLAFQDPGQNVYKGIPDITSICRPGVNNVTVMVRDIWGTYIGCNPVYITTGRNFIVVTEPGMPGDGEWHDLTITRSGSTAKFYYDDDQISPSVAVCLPDEPLRMYSAMGTPAEQAYAFVRKYTANEPAFNNTGAEARVVDLSSGYAYKNTLYINGSPDGAQTDYPVKIIIHKETGASQGDSDSDSDGLPDSVEVHGFMDPLGLHTYTSEPNDDDTDGDGLKDGEEAGILQSSQQCECYYKVISNPRESDSDNDGLDDPDELDWGTKPFDPYSDHDRLTDGEEVLGWYDFIKCLPDGTQVYEHAYFGTEPLDDDTDDDGYDDYVETKGNAVIVYKEEVNSAKTQWGTIYVYDPLIRETHVDWYTALWNGFVSYSVDSPYANNYYYIMGAEYCANLGVLANSIPLFMYAGTSYKYTPGVIVEKAPVTNAAEIAIAEDLAIAKRGGFKNARLAAAERSGANPEAIRNTIIGEVGRSTYDDLMGYGVTESTLKTLVGVIGKERVIRLNEIFREYEVKPTRIQFIDDQIGENINEEGLVKTRVTIDLKKLTGPGKTDNEIQGALNNVEGAYSELQCKLRNNEPGEEWVIDISHVNAKGTDMAQIYNGKLTYYEVKSGYASLSDFTNKGKIFYTDKQGNLKYNAEEAINNLAKSLKKKNPGLRDSDYRAQAEQQWESNSHVQVINVNNEDSDAICNTLQLKIGNSLDYEYKSRAGPNIGKEMPGIVQIVYQPTYV